MENKIYIDGKKFDDFLQERKEELKKIMKGENDYQKAKIRGKIDEINSIQIELKEKFNLKNWYKTK